MEYYVYVAGRDVWITVHRPKVFDDAANGWIDAPGFCVAFKFDNEPGLVGGEYLRDGEKLHWFSTPEAAANAAFEEARNRLK